jgi:hypothetical protein
MRSASPRAFAVAPGTRSFISFSAVCGVFAISSSSAKSAYVA